MAKVSEVLRHAYTHHYDPESRRFYRGPARYMCRAVDCCDSFTVESRRAAREAIHQAMREHAEARSTRASYYLQAMAGGASLASLLTACREGHSPEDLRAWHLALIEKLESEGN